MQQPINEFDTPASLMRKAAVNHAMAGEWSEAVRANLRLIAHDRFDIEAHNRLGKAYSALGRGHEAAQAYRSTLALDRTNRIALRNLQQLELADGGSVLADASGAASEMARTIGATRGATIITRLERSSRADLLGGVAIGEKLVLAPSPAGVRVSTMGGKYLGVLNAKLGVRLAKLVLRGNRYDTVCASVDGDRICVNIFEVFKHESLAGVVSFPAQYIERDEEDGEIDKYDIGSADSAAGGEELRLANSSDDDVQESISSRGRSVLSSEMELPSL